MRARSSASLSKRPPLVAQQITSSDDDHVLFVAVQRPYFCFNRS